MLPFNSFPVVECLIWPAGGTALSAAERAAAELEEFARTAHADVDPHAPPAMKASPSVSGGDGGNPGFVFLAEALAGLLSMHARAPARKSSWFHGEAPWNAA